MLPTTLAFSLAVLAPSPSDATFDALCSKFSGYDYDGDGAAEIDRITPVTSHIRVEENSRGEEKGRVVVLVEGRLLDALPAQESSTDDRFDVARRLERYVRDLREEGYGADLVRVDLAPASDHRDGLLLLAVRRFLIDVSQLPGDFGGAVLVGSFPQASLVRSVNWRKRGPIDVAGPGGEKRAFKETVSYLRTVPEAVAHTCDLVLADLDGNWEERYRRLAQRLATFTAVFPEGVPSAGGFTDAYREGSVVFEDFFFVNDGHLDVAITVDEEGHETGWWVDPLDEYVDQECSADDRALANPIARPEISISRIDARGVAFSPDPSFLDENGDPRSVPAERGSPWRFDTVMERQLLAEYFDRNHRYRHDQLATPFVPASLAHDLGSGYGAVKKGHETWSEFQDDARDVAGHPSVAAALRWFDQPALLRTVRAHSDPLGSAFGRADVEEVTAAAGGRFWEWIRVGDQLVPSAKSAAKGWRLNFPALYSRWKNGGVNDYGSFYIHTGCEAISPPGWNKLPYSDPSYGRMNGASAMLFFAEGLALVGRAKVFYDEPREFSDALREHETFGSAWRRYFDLESRGPVGSVGGDIGRKRAYFWSLLGDWTLSLRGPTVTSQVDRE